MSDQSVSNAVSQLLTAIQSPATTTLPISSTTPTPEELEAFLIKNASNLVQGTVEFVNSMKGFIQAAPTADDLEALASLVDSSSKAIEALNKIPITNKNNDNRIAIKHLDISSRKESREDGIKRGKYIMNREELIEELIKDARLIDVESTTEQL